MGKYLDGRASLVVGTHTHVQTADEQILPGGTGYISDLGMSGPMGGVIGMSKDIALGRFLSGVPGNYEVADGEVVLHGIVAEIALDSGKATSIERVKIGAADTAQA